ncbi:hypothetical protein SAMN06265795_12262 [Noviherbaspirillum humi]|uniref:Uncharacterized protein n=1 Tax=Noviherbaspirillum humi TaxID=1688639 RepID=A0A239LF41_9BURK|nr:hypothetical protein [Noviherbaspirillum humi]SNT29257.1 hypothetical protein SAMN06265795_12262 [Noviherbaspirillum humi]
MINYIEKGYALHQAIRAAGHWLHEENGVWISSNDEAVQAIIDSFDAAAGARAAKVAAIDAHAAKLRNKVVAGISPAEMSSWPLKVKEAIAYLADASADTPMLTMEAQARQITVLELAQRVKANSDQLAMLEAVIAGNAGRHRDAVAALTDWQAVSAYDFSTGWPEI